jgi:inositol transport system substrate-binding protein
MKTTLIAATAMMTVMGSAAFAQNVGASIARFDDNFLTVMRNGMVEYADGLDGVELQVEDAQSDVAKQLDQINNFIASGVDAIIVNPVDTSATQSMTQAAANAGVPLVYVNRQPINVNDLPDDQAFVGSNEIESGTLAAFEACKMARAEGLSNGASAYILMGRLSNQAAVQRTKDVDDVIGMDMCNFIEIIDRQTANWSRDEAQNQMTNWMSSGEPLGGIDMDDVIVTGVDATQDALVAMQAGDLDATVFQDAFGQGEGSVDAAISLANGEDVNQKVYIPFQLVTPENVGEFLDEN